MFHVEHEELHRSLLDVPRGTSERFYCFVERPRILSAKMVSIRSTPQLPDDALLQATLARGAEAASKG